MNTIWEPAKYHNKWAVFDRVSRLFFYVGKGKKFCTEKARELNKEHADNIMSTNKTHDNETR
jgi:hypothetical protein